MEVEEPGLTPEITASVLTEEKVLQLGEKFILAASICLEVPGKNEQIIGRTVMRVALHEESLNTGLRTSMLLTIADLLRWYNLCPA